MGQVTNPLSGAKELCGRALEELNGKENEAKSRILAAETHSLGVRRHRI